MTRPEHSSNDRDSVGAMPYIPLSEDHLGNGASNGDQSVGTLVREASQHMSTLVRAEVELAKAEVVGEVKKGVTGSVFFIIAGVVALYSTFFFFFALAELLADLGLYRSAAYGIVFGLMVLGAAVSGFLGYRKVKKIKAPERTIGSVKETAAALKRKPAEQDADQLTAR
ncbi:MAG: phage holin family protein [Pseudonocardiaceae bacterium]